MKNHIHIPMIGLVLLNVYISFGQVSPSNGLPCGVDLIHSDKPYLEDEIFNHDQISQTKDSLSTRVEFIGVVTIPVVFHIVHLGESIGTGSNLSNNQITQALTGLNQRFRNILGTNSNDLEIQFCLATIDPQGNPTTGIIRVNGSSVPNYTTNGIAGGPCSNSASEASIKNLSMWPINSYYNIWVVHSICSGSIGGYAYYAFANSSLDGTVIDANLLSQNDYTLTHELGHAFDLFHTFHTGSPTTCPPNNNCLTDNDMCCDTPPHRTNDCSSSTPCSTSGFLNNSRFNYMSYCQFSTNAGLFTADQKSRARNALTRPNRSSLVNSNRCSSVTNCSQPINDGCNGNFFATQLSVGSGNNGCTPISSSTCGATSSGFISCTGIQDDDVFFSIPATSPSVTITVFPSADVNSAFQVLTPPCGAAMQEVICVDNSGQGGTETITLNNLTVGSTYFIRVWHVGTGFGSTGNFSICATNPCTLPQEPTNLSATNIECRSIAITWTPIQAQVQYEVLVSNVSCSGPFSSTGIITSQNFATIATVPNTTYYFVVKSINSCGVSLGQSNCISIGTPNNPVTPVISFQGSSSPCLTTPLIIAVTNPQPGLNYYWSDGGTGINRSLLNFNGSLSCYSSNSCGNSSSSNTLFASTTHPPILVGSIIGASFPCIRTTQNYSITPSNQASSYIWRFNGNILQQGNSTSLNFAPTSTGTLTVEASNNCGQSNSLNLIINPISIDTSVQVLGNTLIALGNGTSFQWLECPNFRPIFSANSRSFSALTSGSYAVAINNSNCSDTSECYPILLTSNHYTDDLSCNIVAFPNPTSSELTLIITDIEFGNYKIEVASTLGHNIHIGNLLITESKSSITLNLGDFSSGTLLIRLYNEKNSYSVKVIKSN